MDCYRDMADVPSTRVGAVIVRLDKSICSTGFNGFSKTMLDTPGLYINREEKYLRIIHAEVNALIYSRDPSLEGYTLYTWPLLSCDRCVVQKLQAGISRFVAPVLSKELKPRWKTSLKKTENYIEESNKILTLIDYKSEIT
jgi:dCMP deaminase